MNDEKPQRRTYHHGNLREALLAAALRIVETGGVEKFSVVNAAREAGVSTSAPYRHFADKETLLATLAARGFETMSEWLTAASARSTNPMDALRRSAAAYVIFSRQHPGYFALMFTAGIDKSLLPELRLAAESCETLLESVTTTAFGKDRAPVAAAQLWGIAHGLTALSNAGILGYDSTPAALEAMIGSTVTRWANGVQAERP